MKKKVIIIAAGEHGFVVRNIVAADKHLSFAGFLDDAKTGPDILGPISRSQEYIASGYVFFVAIGNNAARERVFRDLESHGAMFVHLIHPTAVVEPSAVIGKGVMIGARSYVNVHTQVGDGAIINNYCVVEHDNHIGAFVHLAPGVVTGGGVSVGEKTFVGLGAIINDHLTIADNCVVGSGAVVIDPLPTGVTAVGVPAKPVVPSI